jgi:hypothetical protein
VGLIDVRRFVVTTHRDGPSRLIVGDVWPDHEDEWDINLAEVVKVNALAVPAKRSLTHKVMEHELRLLLSFLSDSPGAPVSVRRRELKASSGHIKSFVSESFGLGMLTAAVERHYRWHLSQRDLANFDVLPTRLKSKYPKSGTRLDLLFDFTSQGEDRRLAGEARGRSGRRPKQLGSAQRERLDQVVAWSGRNDFHPVTMTWAYSGAERVQVDLYDIQAPGDAKPVSGTELTVADDDPGMLRLGHEAEEQVESIRERALGRAAEIERHLYQTAPPPTRARHFEVFGRTVRGSWTTADLLAPSSLRLFLGVLDQRLDRGQAGALRRARASAVASPDSDPIQIALTGRIMVVVAQSSDQEPNWSEVAARVERPGNLALLLVAVADLARLATAPDRARSAA